MFVESASIPRPDFCPTLLTPGVLGTDRCRDAWAVTEKQLLQNAIPMGFRVALLCASWERPHGPSGIHATGMSLLPQLDKPIDLGDLWQRMLDEPATRRLLAVTRFIGADKDVPHGMIREAQEIMGPWRKAWQELMAYSAWADALYRVNLPQISPLEDERLDQWMESLVEAGSLLPPMQFKI